MLALTRLAALALTLSAAPAFGAPDGGPDPAPPLGSGDAKTPDAGPKPAPDAGAQSAPDAAPKPPEPPHRIADPRPQRLPDGVFIGKLTGGSGEGATKTTFSAELRVTIVAGRVIDGAVRRPGLAVLDLRPVESGDAIGLRLQGSTGSEFIRVNGAFFDTERGAGRFDGVVGRLQTTGTWLLARR